MSLDMTIAPKCYPVSVEEVKQHLRLNTTTAEEDFYIENLIASATTHAEQKTGRVFVDSEWSWTPSEKEMNGSAVPLPVVPVTSVEVFDSSDQPVSPDLYTVEYPALSPQGNPLIGSLSPLSGFPLNPKIVLRAGYTVEEKLEKIVTNESPFIEPAKTGFTESSVTLVFNRPIMGDAKPENFQIYDSVGNNVPVLAIFVKDDVVEIQTTEASIVKGASLIINYAGGFIHDEFHNYVDAQSVKLPPITEIPKLYIAPDAIPTQKVFVSNCPHPLKQWIMVRTGTLFQQRSEIALRAGKSNDALFPSNFIDNILDTFKIIGFV